MSKKMNEAPHFLFSNNNANPSNNSPNIIITANIFLRFNVYDKPRDSLYTRLK